MSYQSQRVEPAPAPESESGARELGRLKSVSGGLEATGGRLGDVLVAADRAAEEILEAAQAESRAFVSESREATIARAESLREQIDGLLAQTGALNRQVAELTHATERVLESFRAELHLDVPVGDEEHALDGPGNGSVIDDADARQLNSAEPATPVDAGPDRARVPGSVSEGARLIARQMLSAGLDEQQVMRELRDQFGVSDPQAVLDSLGTTGWSPNG